MRCHIQRRLSLFAIIILTKKFRGSVILITNSFLLQASVWPTTLLIISFWLFRILLSLVRIRQEHYMITAYIYFSFSTIDICAGHCRHHNLRCAIRLILLDLAWLRLSVHIDKTTDEGIQSYGEVMTVAVARVHYLYNYSTSVDIEPDTELQINHRNVAAHVK